MGNSAGKNVHDRNYDFRKRPAVRPSPPGKPEVIPDAMLGVDPKKGSDVVNLKWKPPQNSGGSHITGYLVERREMGQGGVGPGVWVRANALLARAPRLAVASLEPGRRYQFRVRAENAAGLLSDPSPPSEPLAIGYQGGIATPPRFLTNLLDKLAVEETRVDFVVDFTGTPAPSVCWYKGNNEIFSTRRTRVATGLGRSTLTFHQVGLADEGEVRCTATNKAGHAVTKALLKVEAAPRLRLPRSLHKEASGSPGSSASDDELLFHLDEVIRLRVGITGRPQPEITWYHNEEKLVPGGRIEIIDSSKHSTLRIPAACRSDRGEYKAKAVNSHGEDCASFLITVTDRPTPPVNVEAKLVKIGEGEESEENLDQEFKPTIKYYLRLSWSAPEDDGGCRIGSYIIEYYKVGWNVWLKGATCRQLSLSLDNLVAGSEYRFRVKAENPYGVSEPSKESESIFLPDPKRGLMAPPEKALDTVDSEWLAQEERLQKEMENRMHEEEQRERLQRKRHDLEEEEEEYAQRRRRRLELSPSPVPSPVPSPTWEGNTSPRADYNTYREGPLLSEHEHDGTTSRRIGKEVHNSGAEGTEFMLVLVPPKESEGGEYLEFRRRSATSEDPRLLEPMEEDEGGAEPSMAPPISLSAPVISGDGEPFVTTLRNAVSSSELLHERAMARIYQEATEEEAARSRSTGAAALRRGSSFARRESSREKESWREMEEKVKEEEVARHSLLKEETAEEREKESQIAARDREDMEDEEEMEEEEEIEEEGEEVYEEEYEEGMDDEEQEKEELKMIAERDRQRAEAIRRQELDLAESETRRGGLSFGAGGRSGRMVTHVAESPPVPPHREFPSPSRSPAESWEREAQEVSESRQPQAEDNQRRGTEEIPYREFRKTRAPVPALHISTIDDDDDNGKSLDPTSVVIGYYGDIIREVSSRVRKASPTIYLSREELKAKAEEDFDPFEQGLLVGEPEEEKKEEDIEPEINEEEIEAEEEVEPITDAFEEESPIKTESPPKEVVEEPQDEVDAVTEIVPARTPSPPRVLTPRELAVQQRVQLIIDSLTTACLLGVASWLLMIGYDFSAATLVGILAAKEVYRRIIHRFPFLRRK